MPELKCTVQTCVHNNQFLCELTGYRLEEAVQKLHRKPAVTASRREKKDIQTAMQTV